MYLRFFKFQLTGATNVPSFTANVPGFTANVPGFTANLPYLTAYLPTAKLPDRVNSCILIFRDFQMAKHGRLVILNPGFLYFSGCALYLFGY